MAARVGLLLRALPLLLWGGLDAQLAERGGQELRREAEVKDVCRAEREPRAREPPELCSQVTQPSYRSRQSALPSRCPRSTHLHTKSLGNILPRARAGTTQARGSALIFPDGGRRERQDGTGGQQQREKWPLHPSLTRTYCPSPPRLGRLGHSFIRCPEPSPSPPDW